MITLNINNDSEKVLALRNLTKLVTSESAQGRDAREAIAKFVGPVITQVLNQVATHRIFFKAFPYDFGSVPSIPLDLFDGNTEGLIDCWSVAIPGGLATNHLLGGDEFRMTTHRYDTAISMLRRNADEGRFELLVKSMERAAQELMLKEKFDAWNVILRALGAARIGGAAQLIDATTQDIFQLDDINRLKTKVSRYRTSFVGGTPTSAPGSENGFTHLVISPEIMGQVRSWAYNPLNTRSVGTGATAVPLPEQVRLQIMAESGLASIAGVGQFVVLNEFGVNQAYTQLFDAGYTAGGGDPGFDSTADELVLAVDLSIDAGVRAVATDSERTTELKFEEDDQFTKRSGKIGWFGGLEVGYAWMDTKALSGIVI